MATRRALADAVPLAVVLGLTLTACSAPGTTASEDDSPPLTDPETGLVLLDGDVALVCGGRGGATGAFPSSALDGGIEPTDPAGVTAALDALAREAGMDAPPALQTSPADTAPWFVLRESAQDVLVAVGAWGPAGPSSVADMTVSLERTDDAWRATSWGSCAPAPALADPGAFWAEIGAPHASASDTELVLQVRERACTSGRDPQDFLREPVLIETTEAVTVYWTSGYVVGDPSSDADGMDMGCPDNPGVERTLTLQEPLGERPVLDGSSWPAHDVRDETVDRPRF